MVPSGRLLHGEGRGREAASVAKKVQQAGSCVLVRADEVYCGRQSVNRLAGLPDGQQELTAGLPVGASQVRDGLQRAAEACGARVQTCAEVVGIASNGARVTGVVLADGRRLAADLVVCNRDLPAAYELLAFSDDSSVASNGISSGSGDSSSSGSGGSAAEYGRQQHARLGRLQFSSGVIAFNWDVSRRLEGLLHHNIFLSDQWRQSWQLAGSREELLPRPNFYVCVPNRTDPSAAPAGCDSVMVLLPVATLQQQEQQQQQGGDPGDLVEAGRQRILQRFAEAGLGDVGAAIINETVTTPADWRQRYGLRHGAAFGLSHGLDQLSIMRWGDGWVGWWVFRGRPR